MASIPNNIARVPTLLGSQIVLSSLNRTNRDIFTLQSQLATGKAINRASDDTVATGILTRLDKVLEQRRQHLRNLSHADSILNTMDAAIGDATNLVLEAKGIASSQVGVGSDAATRANEAAVIDAMIQEMVNIANRKYQDVHFFGGEATGAPPMTSLLGGLQYNGTGEGMVTDTEFAPLLPVTSSGEDVFGALSARVQGERDLDPAATVDTRLADLFGAGGFGIRKGLIDVDVDGTTYALDLTGADTVGDVIAELTDLLSTNEPGALGGGGIALNASGDRFDIDVAAGVTITISDPAQEGAAADLGLAGVFQDGVTETGGDFDPKLTELTPVSALSGVTVPLGTIRLSNAGQSRDLDLSGVETIQQLMNAVHGLDLGIRVEIAGSGDRLNFINQLSGASMSVGEVGGGTTATELGVRSLTGSTLLADFNNGLGVEILSGAVDPVTGVPDPAADVDFDITVKGGGTFSVDLAGAETVQDVLDMINAAAAGAGLVPAQFQATLASDGNGIMLTDNTAGTTTTVTARNGSHAAEHLGILGSFGGAQMTGEDRATVAVDSVFSHLIALRDALNADDSLGITLAAEKLEDDVSRLARAHAEVGVRARRVSDAIVREEDLSVQDMSLRSEVQDLDFTEAAVRFATLQQQLQAGLATAARVSSLSLLDFLG